MSNQATIRARAHVRTPSTPGDGYGYPPYNPWMYGAMYSAPPPPPQGWTYPLTPGSHAGHPSTPGSHGGHPVTPHSLRQLSTQVTALPGSHGEHPVTPRSSHQLSTQVGASPAGTTPTSSPVVTLKCSAIPLVSDWLASLDNDEERGQDQRNFSQFSTALTDDGILRLDDLVDLKMVERVMSTTGSNRGTANLLLKYAIQDVGGLTKGSSKKGRHSK